MSNVVVIDYGMSNLRSVQKGLEKVGAKVTLSSNESVIAKADHLILPGVGAFESGMNGLKDAGLIDVISDYVKTGNHLLGICLGMQMLLDFSEENGSYQGLGLIPGCVKKIPESNEEQIDRKIPHIGWAKIKQPKIVDWNSSCLNKIQSNDFFYFVHSYMAVTESQKDMLAHCEDDGLLIAAAIKKDNVTGLQFHPEKSGEVGLKVLKEFISL
jgi:imidazole glycerol-phosphate synthase subunit HisH